MSDSTSSSVAAKHSQSKATKMPGAWDPVNQVTEPAIDEDIPTPYMIMSLKANKISAKYNILAALCSWLTLAGYIVVPRTFTSLENSESLRSSKGGKVVQDTIQNVPLLPLAAIFFIIRTARSCWLWRIWQQNYV
jgi:hypothetical protein